MDDDVSVRAAKPQATILIVEDDALNTALFKDILAARGYALITAATGPEAIERLKETAPDLIIMDIVVPEISGLDLIRFVKADEALSAIPIVAVTSLPAQLYKDQIMAAGCDAYVAKPLSVTTLWATVDHLLTERRARGGPPNPLMRCMEKTR
ncbi:MAG: response regulator [Alphaproteobacteria bacterium]|nr:response regulator [Alphaproteobacteria bacterium]